MNVLYISSNFEYVQPQIMDALNRIEDIRAYLFSYDLRKQIKQKTLPEYGYYYALNNRIHGPFPYIYRLHKIKQEVIKHYKSYDINIMHANMGFRDGIICYMVWKKIHIPYIVSIRNTDLNAGFIWKIPYIKNYCFNVLQHSSYVICLSDSYKKQLLRKLPKKMRKEIELKIRIIPNGIDPYYLANQKRKESKNSEDIRNLLFVGRVSRLKNLEKVIDAVEILNTEGYSFNLDVVGEIIDKEYIALMNGKEYVHYHEKSPKEELIKYYRNSDIFVMPSHTETFGLVYVEAMSQGLPVIYTRGQGFDSEGRDGIIGFAVSDQDSREIADRILSIRKNYDIYSKNCSEMAKEYDWRHVAAKIVNLYRSSR